jgi:hypothetical protein
MGGVALARRPLAERPTTVCLAAVLIVALAVAVGTYVPAPRAVVVVGGVVFAGIAIWMLVNPKPEWPLAVLALYLGFLDGFLKLSTGDSNLTIARDVLLYAIVAGMLIRAAVQRKPLTLPPLSSWVLAFVALVGIQLVNPNDHGTLHTLGALRPELEFVPLFFLGYQVLRTPQRVRRFFFLLLLCATANGVVNFLQFNLTPSQFASWGPGYARYINGTGDVAGRTYTVVAGLVRVRPFGLGTDTGSGAEIGLISLGAALALMTLGARRPKDWLVLLFCVGPPLAVVTGQLRTAVIGGIIAVAFFLALTVSARRIVPTLAGLGFAVLATIIVINVVGSASGTGAFARYATLSPGSLLSTAAQSRGGSLALIPSLALHFPLGGGLGAVGPAASFAGGAAFRLNGETQFTFFISDIGVPGLLLMLAFNLRLLQQAWVRIRHMPHEARVLVAGLAAGIAGMFVEWASGPTTATSPGGPYFWFAVGALAYWMYPKTPATLSAAASSASL